jgi:hypothetical protein
VAPNVSLFLLSSQKKTTTSNNNKKGLRTRRIDKQRRATDDSRGGRALKGVLAEDGQDSAYRSSS